MTRRRGRAVTAALALAAATGIWVVAAAAPAAAYVCAFAIDKPPTSGSTVVNLTGPFVVRQGSADRILEVTVTSWPGGGAPPPVRRQGAAVGPADRYDVPLSGLTRNGSYTARVKASHAGSGVFNCVDGIGVDQRDTERSGEITFGVSVRAAPPSNVQARFDAAARSATVTWDKSGDPDIAGYKITKKVGSDPASDVDVPPEPRSWTDTDLPGGAASITYSVQAARVGPLPNTTSELSSPAAADPLAVPAPPAPPTSTTTGTGTGPGTGGTGGGGGTGGTPTSVKAGAAPPAGTTPTTRPFVLGRPVGGTPARGDRSAELGSSDLNLPEGQLPDDGTYRPLLPYPARDELNVDDDEVAADPAVVGRAEGPGGDGIPQLAYIASGLLSSVVAAHVLWLRKQVAQPEPAGGLRPSEPLEPLEPLEPPPSSPRSPVPAPPAPPAPPGPSDDGPTRAASSPFSPVLLVGDLKRRNDPSTPAGEAGPFLADADADVDADVDTKAAAARPVRQPLRATRLDPDAAAVAAPPLAAGGRRPLRSPTREAAAAEAADVAVPADGRRTLRSPARQTDEATAVAEPAARRRPLRSPARETVAAATAVAPPRAPVGERGEDRLIDQADAVPAHRPQPLSARRPMRSPLRAARTNDPMTAAREPGPRIARAGTDERPSPVPPIVVPAPPPAAARAPVAPAKPGAPHAPAAEDDLAFRPPVEATPLARATAPGDDAPTAPPPPVPVDPAPAAPAPPAAPAQPAAPTAPPTARSPIRPPARAERRAVAVEDAPDASAAGPAADHAPAAGPTPPPGPPPTKAKPVLYIRQP